MIVILIVAVQQTMICRADFLDQRVGPVNPLPGEDQPGDIGRGETTLFIIAINLVDFLPLDSELWRAIDEFEVIDC